MVDEAGNMEERIIIPLRNLIYVVPIQVSKAKSAKVGRKQEGLTA